MSIEEKNITRENKMGVWPIPKLLITMSLPMIASMLVQALYNIIDSMFVSRLGETALTAVALSYPLMSLLIAFGVGTGVGVNALVSRYLGAKKFDDANAVAKHAMFLPLFTSAAFVLTAHIIIPAYFHFQTTDPEIYKLGINYLNIAVYFSVGSMYQIMFEKLLSSTGKTTFTMITQITGALINIILDPILIFGYWGLPAMGVKGAAIATVIAQSIAAILGLCLNLIVNKEISFNLNQFKPSISILKKIYKIGFPSILLPAMGAIMNFFMNTILLSHTSTASAVFGIYFNLQSFVFMPIFGLNNGLVPIVAYNFGAKKNDRIRQTVKLSMIFAVSYMFLGYLVFQLFPNQLLGLFNANSEMLEIGITAFRTISYSFLLAGISIIISATSQALGYGHFSLIISISRQLIILIPLAYLLSKMHGLSRVWLAYPFAEIFALGLSLILLRKLWNKEKLSE